MWHWLLEQLLLFVILLAPVPMEAPPDPLGWGYLGVRAEVNTLELLQVDPDTPASKAGMQVGDVIIKLGTFRPRTWAEVVNHVSDCRPGTLLKIEVRRNNENLILTPRLGARPADQVSPHQNPQQ